MSNWPTFAGARWQDQDSYSGSVVTNINHDAAADTYDSWKSIIASTNFHAKTMMLGGLTSLAGGIFDVGVDKSGGTSSYDPIIEWFCPEGTWHPTLLYAGIHCGLFPVDIPAGSRVGIRTRHATANGDFGIVIKLGAAPFMGMDLPWRISTFGRTSSNSRGEIFGSGNGVWSAWTEIQNLGASASLTHTGRVLWVKCGSLTSSPESRPHVMQLAYKSSAPSGSDASTLIGGELVTPSAQGTNCYGHAIAGPFFVNLPSGRKFYVRAMSNAAFKFRSYNIMVAG